LVSVATGEILLGVKGIIMDSGETTGNTTTGKVASAEAVKDLIKRCRLEDNRSARKVFIRDLAETNSPAAAKFLAEEMLTQSPFDVPDALISMGNVGTDALARAVEIGDFHERITAMRTFAKVATKKHLPLLKRLSTDIHLRNEAERAIRRIQSE
jgi:hypothetical protein